MGYTNARGMMSDAKFFEAYSRYDESLSRYETWNESVERVMEMHREYYADKMTAELDALMKEVETAYKDKLFLGAQRALQFGGEQLLKHHARLYNCTASYADRPAFFGEAFYLMLSGCGVGFSVQKHHVAKLPEIRQRTKTAKTFVVPDSVEGWATSLDVLLSSFFVGGGRYPEYEGKKVNFDLTEIRPKNALISGGFKAPGPEVLRVNMK
jgi:ribonucleoside-diphosphate reductase alpha chain